MKVNVKKALATIMATALIVTSGQCPVASAAKKPALSSKKVTLKVGQKKTLKVKNKIKGSTYTWKSSKVKVAKVTKKGVVKAVKAGTATITCKVKTKATKKKKAKTYTLKCKVTVKKKSTPKPTTKPTTKPTAKPAVEPTVEPSDVPSDIPSNTPTQVPSDNPSTVPSTEPSTAPTTDPSASPSVSPSVSPSASPSTAPSGGGGYYRPSTNRPTTAPSTAPSTTPSTEPSATPSTTPTEGIEVTTVAKLKEEAQKAAANTTITLKTEEKDAVIDAADYYSNVDLIVDSPNGHITNSAVFNSVTIEQISETTWIEKAKQKLINIKTAAKAHIELAAGAEPEQIKVIKSDGAVNTRPEIKITVNGGTAGKIVVNAVVKLDIVKDSEATGPDAAIPVEVTIADTSSEGSGEETQKVEVTSAVQVAITTKSTVDVAITLEADAKGSTIKAESAGDESSLSILNKTDEKINVTGDVTQEIPANQQQPTTVTVTASETERLKLITDEITWDKISTEEMGKVTKDLTLPQLEDLKLAASVTSGASITWSVEPSNSAALTNAGKVTRPSAGSENAAVTLKATIGGFDSITDGSNVKPFSITILAEESAESTKPTITALADVSYTVATSAAVEGSTTTGSSITVTEPEATVTDAGTNVTTFKYAVSESKDNAPAIDGSTNLDISDNTKEYYLWIQVTVGETTETFVSEKLDLTASEQAKTTAMTKKPASGSN